MEELLRGLASTEGGMARLANLADGLVAEHITTEALAEIVRQADVLREREHESPEADWGYNAYSLLRNAFLKVQAQLYFRRPRPPSGDMQVRLSSPIRFSSAEAVFSSFRRNTGTRRRKPESCRSSRSRPRAGLLI